MRRDIALLSQHFQRVSFQTNVFLEQLKSHNKRKTRIPDREQCGRVRRWHFLCFWCSELNVITLAGKFPTQRFHMGKILPGNKTGNFLSAKMFFQTWKSWQLCWQTEITRCASVVLRSFFFFPDRLLFNNNRKCDGTPTGGRRTSGPSEHQAWNIN